jgi:MFS family permease
MPHHGTRDSSSDPSELESAAVLEYETPVQATPLPPPGSGLAATFRSLRHRNYRLYFFGQLVSLLGTWMQTTALTWLAFDMTKESKWPSLIVTAQILPTFLLGAWGGTLAERWPKRSLIFLTQSAFALLAILLAGLTFAGVATPWQLLVVTAVSGLVQAVDLPARLAFVMDLTGREDLPNAVALNSMLFNVARALGPAASALLLRWVYPETCFLVNALSYVAVLLALARMDVAGSAPVVVASKGVQSLLEGFRYLANRRHLAFLVLLAGTTAMCGWASQPLLPALAERTLGSNQVGYSLMLSSTGAGALLAAWFAATFGSAEKRWQHIGAGVGIVSGALVGLSFATNLPVAVACCALLGFGLILLLAVSQSVVQLGARDHIRGRVMGIWAMALSGAVPLGSLLFGPAADQWGVPPVLRLEGLACAATALGLLGFFFLWQRPSR